MEGIVDREGRELKLHGSLGFPCGAYSGENQGFPWHWHDEIEMIAAMSGRLIVAVGEQRLPLEAGDAAIVGGGLPHAVLPTGGMPYHENDIVFHPSLVFGDEHSAMWEHYGRRLLERGRGIKLCGQDPADAPLIARIQEAWSLCGGKPPLYEFQVRQALTEVFAALWARLPEEGGATRGEEKRSARVKRMMLYLMAHWQEEVTLHDLAADAHLSERECQRSFRAGLGMSPLQYLNQVRLNRAAELLRNGEKSITEICYSCGFQNSSYFARRFRERYGVTPRDFREERGTLV